MPPGAGWRSSSDRDNGATHRTSWGIREPMGEERGMGSGARAVMAAGIVALTAGGCAAPSTPTGPSPSAPASVSIAAPTAPSVAPTSSAPIANCATSALKGSLGPEQGAAGSVYTPLVLTNVGPRTCELRGFPGVSYVAGDDGHQVGPAAVMDG